MEADQVAAAAYVTSDAEEIPAVVPPVSRQDLEEMLDRLAEAEGERWGEHAHAKDQRRWRLRGLGKRPVTVTTDREILERERDVLPITGGVRVLERLAERLVLPASRSTGAGRLCRRRLPLCRSPVSTGRRITPVTSVAQPQEKALAAWDGTLPSPTVVLKAQTQARTAARKRVETTIGAARLRRKRTCAASWSPAGHRQLLRN